jgi:hypothetical protein
MTTFDICLNKNFAFPAYQLECKTGSEAFKIAKREAKFNCNDSVHVFEVNSNGDVFEGSFVKEFYFNK